MKIISWIICLSSAIASWQLILWLIPIFKKYLEDIPNERSSHNLPTPRGGGIAFVLITIIASVISSLFIESWSPIYSLTLICTPLAVIGLIDDRLNLPASLRYGAQLLTSIFIVINSSLTFFSNNFLEGFLFIPITLIALTALINFINFMDGLDGLVAGCLIVSLFIPALFLSHTLPIWSLIGALMGFLYWNWSPSKIFMGDVGSTFLGAFFGGLVLQANEPSQALGLLLIPFPLLSDAFFCVIRRVIAGQNIFQAHRLHLYQRLYLAGWSKPKVASSYITASILLASSFAFMGLVWEMYFAILILFIGFFADKKLALSFETASK
tara:strand:- start:3524 stop:4498 length:975 start_codon:yes stop_codon:yes gene_type:complete